MNAQRIPAPAAISIQLDDGTRAVLRSITPADKDRERDFILSLSPMARRHRFLEQIGEPGDALLDALTQVDHRDQEAIIAVPEHGPLAGTMIGVARYARRPGDDEAEFAIAVLDALRGGSLQRQLLTHLTEIARVQGIGTLYSIDCTDNHGMQAFAALNRMKASPDPDDHTLVRYVLTL